jgi:hypothetical protein
MTASLVGRTFPIVLPTSWWLVQYVFASTFGDWNQPAFYDAYILPQALFDWIHERTGWWGGKSSWVASQDAVVALVGALALAHLLVRRTSWQSNAAIRGAIAFAGVLLPWHPFLIYSPLPDYHRTAGYALCTAYVVAAMGLFILPLGPPIKVALALATIFVGVWFAILRFDGWDWDYYGSLFGSSWPTRVLGSKTRKR